MKKVFFVIAVSVLSSACFAQFAPQVGYAGTTAIHKDSSVFINWAKSATLQRGWQDIADTAIGRAQVGDETYIPGKAGNGIVSLGDGGSAIVTFEKPIMNGAGFDFAVFENGFIDENLKPGNAFLELAFVEVSSDGINYFRFDAETLIDSTKQMGSFEAMSAEKINNFAGKYIANYGTPFDLEELDGIEGLDVNRITHVKIADVIGTINPLYATRDSKGRKVNDPYPTSFASGGFDLDAVGVIHENNSTGIHDFAVNEINVYPNPASSGDEINIQFSSSVNQIAFFDVAGKKIDVGSINQSEGLIMISIKEAGIYFVKGTGSNGKRIIKRIMVK